MKNSLNEQPQTGLWIAAAITGALAAGAGIWFYLRGKRAAGQEAYRLEHAQDYLSDKQKFKKKHKSDINNIAAAVHHAQL